MNAINIKIINTCFESEFYPQLFEGTSTHEPALKLAMQLVRVCNDDALIVDIVRSGLPENYSGDTMKEVRKMISSGREKLSEESDEDEKYNSKPTYRKSKDNEDSHAEVLLKILKNHELFHDAENRSYIVIDKRNFLIGTHDADKNLERLFYLRKGKAISKASLTQVNGVLEAKALYDYPLKNVFTRVASADGKIIINLANKEMEVVVIDKHGWVLTSDSPAKFIYYQTLQSFYAPTEGGCIKDFQTLLGVGDENFILILAFIINALNPDGPYWFLLVEGEQGSGKSFLCHLLKMLIDPNFITKQRLPDNIRDLMIQAQENHLLVFDNLSGMKGEMSDILCTLSTGGGFSTRALYSNSGNYVFKACRPFIMNGIEGVANRPDLLERCISITLPTMPEGHRKTEKQLHAEFETLKPQILGWLCTVLSCALRRIDEIDAPTEMRMADAAHFLVAAEPATGYLEGTFLRALDKGQSELIADRILENTLVQSLITFMKNQYNKRFEGTTGDLFAGCCIGSDGSRFDHTMPKTPAHLSRALKRLKPALTKIGVHVEFGEKKRSGKFITVKLDHDDSDNKQPKNVNMETNRDY